MESILRTLLTVSGDAAALYIYRRVIRGQLVAMGLDATIVATVADDFKLWGTSTTPEGAALEKVVMDQIALASPTLTPADLVLFVQALGTEIAADYPLV